MRQENTSLTLIFIVAVLTAALLDRLLHHAETVVIEGKSYRMKGKLEV